MDAKKNCAVWLEKKLLEIETNDCILGSGHGTQCHPLTGRCFCTTKGVVGDHCERCDVANHYSSGLLTVTPATSSNLTFLPTCYYDLQLDFQFTFNLSKKEDRHIKQINFRNVPLKPDLDLEFSVLCSSVAKLNISVRSVKPNSLHKVMILWFHDYNKECILAVCSSILVVVPILLD